MLKYATNIYLYRGKIIDNGGLRGMETEYWVNAFFSPVF